MLPKSSVSHYYHFLHNLPYLTQLQQLHAHLLRNLIFFSHPIITSKLIISYTKFKKLKRNTIIHFMHPLDHPSPWNTIIAITSRKEQTHGDTIKLFALMRRCDARPDPFTLPPVIRSCAVLACEEFALCLHGVAFRVGLHGNQFVASAMVRCYMELGRIEDALMVFDEMAVRDCVLWTCVLSGYSQNGRPERAVELFRRMVGESVRVDEAVLVSLSLACAQMGRIEIGRSVHGFGVRKGLGGELTMGNALIDMYVKCGDLGSAERVFSCMPSRDVISSSALILGYGLNGHVEAALKLFEDMREEGIEPNSVSFLGVLSACGHAGLVDRGLDFFYMMYRFGLEPELKHYACVVDAMGKAGRLPEAERFVNEMPMEPDEAILGALLAGCKMHGVVDVAERVSQRLMMMFPDKSGYYMSLANLYADVGRFDHAEEVRMCMKKRNVGKTLGSSLVELNGSLHVPRPV